MIRRRKFLNLLRGAAVAWVAWPLAARTQQGERTRRIGVLMPFDESDPAAKTYASTFTQALADLGWIDGRNLSMYVRWAAADIDRMQALAKELVGLQPDIIVASGTPATAALQRETRTIPIVFVNVSDPGVSGIVAALNQPGREYHRLRPLRSLAGRQVA